MDYTSPLKKSTDPVECRSVTSISTPAGLGVTPVNWLASTPVSPGLRRKDLDLSSLFRYSNRSYLLTTFLSSIPEN